MTAMKLSAMKRATSWSTLPATALAVALAVAAGALAADPPAEPAAPTAENWPPASKSEQPAFDGRKVELFEHGVREEWGYGKALWTGRSFYVVHPKTRSDNAPMVVILHSGNQSARIWLDCGTLKALPPEDAGRCTSVPEGFYGLFLNSPGQEWWGKNAQLSSANPNFSARPLKAREMTPTEKRVIDTVEWAAALYKVDRNRIYLTGASMGGCGSIAIGGSRGDIFAAVRVFNTAGFEFLARRAGFDDERLTVPDPPVMVSLAGMNDGWSKDHGLLIDAARRYRLPLILGWGPFGHSGLPSAIKPHRGCEAVLEFPWMSIRKDEAYPVFSAASSDQRAPWTQRAPWDMAPGEGDDAGQINGYFRWQPVADTAEALSTKVWLYRPSATNAVADAPDESVADITFRRLQRFAVPDGQACSWTSVRDGQTIASGTIRPDASGLLTIPKVKIVAAPTEIRLTLKAGKP